MGFRKVFTSLWTKTNLKNAITIIGCVLFALSAIFPFYQVYLWAMGGGTINKLWSFKIESQTWSGRVYRGEKLTTAQLWFFDYWFGSFSNLIDVGSSLSVFGISWILPLLFTIQVLTLTFGVASLIFKRKVLAFLPVLLTFTILLLELYTNWVVSPTGEASSISVGIGFLFTGGEYQLGYYLVYPSLLAFLLAFILNEVIRTRKHQPEKSN